LIAGFTKKYSVKRLVYFERYEEIQAAIQREHNIKHMESQIDTGGNPNWNDLYESIC
jgi:putative endonuclease